MHDFAITMLATGLGLALLGFCLVLLAAVRRPLLMRGQYAQLAREEVLLTSILTAVDPTNAGPLAGANWSSDKRLVARVLHKALACVSSETASDLIARAQINNIEKGLVQLARSKSSQDRYVSAKLLVHFPKLKAILVRTAKKDPNIAVRAHALKSLAQMGLQPAPRVWSSWIQLGQSQPNPALKLVLGEPRLVSDRALCAAASSASAPDDVRIWAIGALIKRDPDAGYRFVRQLISDDQMPSQIISEVIKFIDDPLFVTQFHVILGHSTDWRVREALCHAALRTYAFTLMPQMTQLASDQDWRVRSAALAAMKRLGGFDNVPMPAAMRAVQMSAYRSAREVLPVSIAS